MSNSKYRETFMRIKKVKESNINLLSTMIQCVNTFTGKISKLMDNLGKVSSELPTKKAKKRNPFFKQDNNDQYEVIDQDFNTTWNTITSGFICKPQDSIELSNLMREYFIDKLKEVQNSYADSTKTLESSFQVYLRDFDEIREKYTKAIQNYNSIHSKIEQINEKLKPENINGKNPEYVEKLKAQQSDAKDELPPAENQAALAAEAFNEANISFSINSERLLSEFERIDKEHALQLKAVFAEFFNRFPEIIELDKKIAINIQVIANPKNISQDKESKNITDYKEVIVRPNFPMPSFNISDFIDPSEIFNTELIQKVATVTSKNVPGFDQGSLVVIISDNGKDITIADVKNYKSAVVKKNDIQIENLKRTIAQLKEDHAVHTQFDNFVWKAKEYLLITHHKSLFGQNVWCTDMFGRSALVPFIKLTQ